VPLYQAIPKDPDIDPNVAVDPANFYGALADLIQSENPYGEEIIVGDITTEFDNSPEQRADKMNKYAEIGVRLMGWLRGFWSTQPIVRCNDRMTITEKQQSFHWITMYHEEGTARFPNDDNAAPNAFDPPTAVPFDIAGPNANTGGRTAVQNSPDFELNQVCKAIYIPFKYKTKEEHPRTLQAALLIGYVGTGGGE